VNWHLLVVDIQEAFAPHIHGWERVIAGGERMIQAARKLAVPVTATEQNPAKLGPTVPRIARALGDAPVYTKMAFSSLRVPAVWRGLAEAAPVNVVCVGIEAHVCVLQTALDALAMPGGVTPFVPVDAVSSRRELDRDTALRRLERAGAVLTTVESVIFEILEEAGTDRFRAVLPLVK
jgi:nicotinamidase-related amidase